MENKLQKKLTPKAKKRIAKTATLIAALVLSIVAVNDNLYVQRYYIETDKLNDGLTVALVSDLHSSKYGDDMNELVTAIEKEEPDLLFMTGDIFEEEIPHGNSETFLSEINGKYPCYYVTGNHEYKGGKERYDEIMAIIEKYDVKVLSDECETIEIDGETVNICGVEDPSRVNIFPEYDSKQALYDVSIASDNGYYTILLSHRPELFEKYVASDFDLVLAGHAHGGQWRIPIIMNGLYAPDQGILPKYAGGCYGEEDTKMVVSRGLSRGDTYVPRIFNRPELVIVEIGESVN